jgi:methylthioribose-1-phosphate isomerase
MIPTLAWTPEGVRFIDQTKLPLEESYVLATTYEQVADVIVTMVVRGAPAIGVSGVCARVRADLRSFGRNASHGGESLLGYRPHEAAFCGSSGR